MVRAILADMFLVARPLGTTINSSTIALEAVESCCEVGNLRIMIFVFSLMAPFLETAQPESEKGGSILAPS